MEMKINFVLMLVWLIVMNSSIFKQQQRDREHIDETSKPVLHTLAHTLDQILITN